jgi:hypothetical protein
LLIIVFRERKLLGEFLVVEKAKDAINVVCIANVIDELGMLIIKLVSDTTVQPTNELDSMLSVICDLCDGDNGSRMLEQFSISSSFISSMLAIVSRWKNLRENRMHNCFHMILYLALGLISERNRFHNFMKKIVEDCVFDDVANMPTLLLQEIQVECLMHKGRSCVYY